MGVQNLGNKFGFCTNYKYIENVSTTRSVKTLPICTWCICEIQDIATQVKSAILYHFDLFGMTLWPWHIWWIRHLGTHLVPPWYLKKFSRPCDWLDKLWFSPIYECPKATMSWGRRLWYQQVQKMAKMSLFCTKSCPNWQLSPNLLSVGAFVTRDINQISVSVDPAVTCDYRIDWNGIVMLPWLISRCFSKLYRVQSTIWEKM